MPGVILLIAFIPQHVMLWNTFPVWYHLTFLLSLVPLTYLGGTMWSAFPAVSTSRDQDRPARGRDPLQASVR
jgi:hypothetical protein